jgi:riboflavin biosynthesis pyrimidine reductase
VVATTGQAPAPRVAAVRRQGATVVQAPCDGDGRVDLAFLLRELHGRGVGSVLVEGGASVITSLLRIRMVDRVVVRIAPRMLGAGIEAVGDLDILRLDDALSFERTTFRQVGPDVIFDGAIRGDDAA